MDISNCRLCPRQCLTDRTRKAHTLGFCGAGSNIKVARAALHQWEEPCISGTNGSGTVFFSGCTLKCCFCQNYKISNENFGKEISVERLAEIFLELKSQGAHNINLVNPTHYAPWIIGALDMVKSTLGIPIIYNSGGYENLATLKMLEGYIDVYLPDLKYIDNNRAKRYSSAYDYPETAKQALLYMYKQVGKIELNSSGIIQKGVIIRHLVMPKGLNDALDIIDWIANSFPKENILVSIMSQYEPFYKSDEYVEINRKIFSYEYNKVVEKADKLGLSGFMQEKSSACKEYTPNFNLQGI